MQSSKLAVRTTDVLFTRHAYVFTVHLSTTIFLFAKIKRVNSHVSSACM